MTGYAMDDDVDCICPGISCIWVNDYFSQWNA